MNRRRVGVVVILVFLCIAGTAAYSEGVRSIGLRVVLPIGRTPFFVGIEAAGDVPLGLLTGSFFLSSAGKVLITTSYDVQMVGSPEGSRTFLRATIGLSYFDPAAFLPSMVLGGGLALDVPVASFLACGAAAEFLYPFAFPAPLVSASARGLLP